MTINTKYNPGQEVWIMKDNKPIKLFVHAIRIVAGMNNDKNAYFCAMYCYKETELCVHTRI